MKSPHTFMKSPQMPAPNATAHLVLQDQLANVRAHECAHRDVRSAAHTPALVGVAVHLQGQRDASRHLRACVCTHTRVHTHAVFVCACMCVCVHACVCLCACACVRVYVCAQALARLVVPRVTCVQVLVCACWRCRTSA